MKYLLLLITVILSFYSLGGEITLETRKMSLKNFPCMSCHGGFENKKVDMPLTRPHEDLFFKHMSSIKNCYSCHDQKDRDFLKLNSGKKISFDESYKLCFQCHGEKKRDWEKGIHGKQIGSWNGDKYKFVCTSCHEAHHPKFPLMKADKGPVHPHAKKSNLGKH